MLALNSNRLVLVILALFLFKLFDPLVITL